MPNYQPDLMKLARRQRWLIWLFLAGFLLQVFPPMLVFQGRAFTLAAILIGVGQLFLFVLMVVGAVMLVSAQGSHPAVTGLVGLFMLAPCANLIVLLLVSLSVNRTFRRAGIRVGFFGVNEEALERALDPMLCRGCGYNLTGNESGVCPECGRPCPRCRCANCNNIVEAVVGMECPKCSAILS